MAGAYKLVVDVICAWALVAIGAWGVRTALGTLAAIKTQTAATVAEMKDASCATREAVAAYERHIDVLISSQRAWLAVKLESFPPLERYQAMANEIVERYIVARVWNCGQTIARIQYPIHVECRAFGNVPETPNYEEFRAFKSAPIPEHGLVLAPRQAFEVPIPMALLTDDEVSKIKERKLTLCAYCSMLYNDATGTQRELRFCYVYDPEPRFGGGPPGFYIGGPKEYNKQT